MPFEWPSKAFQVASKPSKLRLKIVPTLAFWLDFGFLDALETHLLDFRSMLDSKWLLSGLQVGSKWASSGLQVSSKGVPSGLQVDWTPWEPFCLLFCWT